MKIFLHLCLIVLVAVFLLIHFKEPLLRRAGEFLVVRDDLKKADVIVVLGGMNNRVDEAARVYQEGYARYLIVSGGSCGKHKGRSQAGLMRDRAVRLGVPKENVLLEPHATSTYRHPGLVLPILREHGFRSAIIVSSPEHMRRAKLLFDREYRNQGITLIYHPVRGARFDPRTWWTSPGWVRVVRSEYSKMLVNMWGAGFSRFVDELIKKHPNCPAPLSRPVPVRP